MVNYQPYNKPDYTPLYININSNEPPNFIRHLPQSISNLTNNSSSNKAVFDQLKDIYKGALSNSGFKQKINLDLSLKKKKHHII